MQNMTQTVEAVFSERGDWWIERFELDADRSIAERLRALGYENYRYTVVDDATDSADTTIRLRVRILQ